MKRIFSSILLLTVLMTGYSQQNWTEVQSLNGVTISSTEMDCDARNIPAQKAVILKVENSSNATVVVEWDLMIWYNDEPAVNNIADGENHYSIEIPANAFVEGTCDVPYGALYIFRDFITYQSDTKLTRFELQNLKVTVQN